MATIEVENLRMAGDPVDNPWAYPTFAAVGPRGEVVVRHLTPGKLGEIGDVPIKLMSGRAMVDPLYEERGWVGYEALCAGKVVGVEADPLAWTHWKNLVGARAKGYEPPPASIRWHPEIARRVAGGGSTTVELTAEQVAALFPEAAELAASDDATPPKSPSPAKR